MPEVEVEAVGTKRSMDHDEYGGQTNKVMKSDGQMEVRLLLLGRNCGGIIGKGGENITRLRNNYNVNLRMPSTQTLDRVMTIQGTVENCIGVVREVLSHSTQVPYSTNQQCSVEINLLVPTTLVGSIVGKGGSRITEIRETTKTKIKVYEECLPGSNERVIAIGGDNQDQILVTLTTILNIFRDIPSRPRSSYYLPENNTGGGPAMRLPPLNKKPPPNNWAKDATLMGGAGFVSNAGPLMGGSGGSGPQPLMGAGNPVHPSALKSEPPTISWLNLQTVTSVTAPNDVCGAIIGKGGSRISEIRNGSGAQINFSEATKDSKDDRVITISGTQQQVQRAEQMITRFMSTV